MNQQIELSIEKKFTLHQFTNEVEAMSGDEAKAFLLRTYETLLQHQMAILQADELIRGQQEFIKQLCAEKWEIPSNG